MFLSFLAPPLSRAHPEPVDLQVWDNRTYSLQTQLRGHTGSVLALEYASDKHWLFSSSGVFRVYFHDPQITELITGDSSVRVRTLRFPGPLPAHSHIGVGHQRAYPALRYQPLPRH